MSCKKKKSQLENVRGDLNRQTARVVPHFGLGDARARFMKCC